METAKEKKEQTSVSAPAGDTEKAPADAGQRREESKEEDFKRLMEGAYKEQFRAYFNETFNRRFREHKEMQKELAAARRVVEAAAARYGTADIDSLLAYLADPGGQEPGAEQAQDAAQPARAPDQGLEEALERAREEATLALLDSIRARGLRPRENSLLAGGGIGFDNGALRLTRADRAEMARRAAKGERISF